MKARFNYVQKKKSFGNRWCFCTFQEELKESWLKKEILITLGIKKVKKGTILNYTTCSSAFIGQGEFIKGKGSYFYVNTM